MAEIVQVNTSLNSSFNDFSNTIIDTTEKAAKFVFDYVARYKSNCFGLCSFNTKGKPIKFQIATLDCFKNNYKNFLSDIILSNSSTVITYANSDTKKYENFLTGFTNMLKVLGIRHLDHIVFSKNNIYKELRDDIYISYKRDKEFKLDSFNEASDYYIKNEEWMNDNSIKVNNENKITLRKEKSLSDNKKQTLNNVINLLYEEYSKKDTEHFIILNLDINCNPINYSTISKGGISSTVVHPIDVLKTSLLSGAKKVIVLHNHPSGDSTPSKEDLATTVRLETAFDSLNITLEDSLILPFNNSIYSIKQKQELDLNDNLQNLLDTASDKVKKQEVKVVQNNNLER